jgi:hypothetical protein
VSKNVGEEGHFERTGDASPAKASLAGSSSRLSRWLVLVGAFSFVWMVGTAILLGFALLHLHELQATVEATPGQTEPARAGASAAAASSATKPTEPETPKLPESTRVSSVGAIDVVELGRTAAELPNALRHEADLAQKAGRRMLVLVTEEGDCAPCRGIDRALADSRLQDVLGRVRLVRLLRSAFKEELSGLRLRTDVYPMFLLLDDELGLRDAIHGGEWDDDVAANIAPVLSAFLGGTYTARRHPKWSPAVGSTKL